MTMGGRNEDMRGHLGATGRLCLRPALTIDVAFALELYLSGAALHLSALGPVDKESLRARFDQSYCQDRSSIICLSGEDIGWMQVLDAEDRIYIEQLHLLAPYRNRGVGRTLIADIFSRALASNRPVELSVIRGNPAIRLYGRLGFRLIAEEPEKLRMRWENGPPRT
jgi:ribosomal protein S18 acetylase RimI-like enzyme